MPNFIQVHVNIPESRRLSKTKRRLKRIILRAVIKDSRMRLAFIEAKLYDVHLLLVKHIPKIKWDQIDRNSYLNVQQLHFNQKRRHYRKFQALKNEQQKPTILPELTSAQLQLMNNPKVLNRSGIVLENDEHSVLELGLNFSTKRDTNTIGVISATEQAFKYSKLKSEQKEFLRHKIAQVVQDNMIPERRGMLGLNKLEITKFKILKEHKELVVSPADKGGTVVIMHKNQYHEGLVQLLSNDNYSTALKKDLELWMKKVKEVVNSSDIIPRAKKQALIPSYYQPGRLYLVPKIHKPGLTFRPILSCINTPSHLLAKFILRQLKPLSESNPYTVCNNSQFISKLRNETGSQCIMVSFDVISMFTTIPVNGAIQALENRLKVLQYSDNDIDAILKIVVVCTQPPVFSANNSLYKQIHGLPMGGSLSPILCDIYLWQLEERIHQESPVPIQMYSRYVDDTFTLLQLLISEVNNFLTWLNSLDEHVQFTVELENDRHLAFLDISIQRTESHFQTTVYRKPFAVSVPPHARSHHIASYKKSAFYFYVQRALNLCSSRTVLVDELNFLKHVAVDRGYNPKIIDLAYDKFTKPRTDDNTTLLPVYSDDTQNRPRLILSTTERISSKINTILRAHFKVIMKPTNLLREYFHPPKDIPDMCNKPGVYYIPCQCNLGYIGQCSRSLRYRLYEHKSAVKKGDINKSNIAEHSWALNHSFNFDEAKIVYCTTNRTHLNTFETSFIIKYSKELVNDTHFPPLSSTWNNLILSSMLPPLRKTRMDSPELT